ncbi:MAG: hypothetical protein ACTSVY_09470 [Candidatus Helarchaeota archaeon]
MSKKYFKGLTTYFKESKDSNSMDYIAREFLGLMKQKCEKCLRYRTECALNPHCKDRKYINILISLNVKPDDLPGFCYLQHKRSIENLLKGKPNLFEPIDAKLYLKDFLDIVGVKKTLSKNIRRICHNLDILLPKLSPIFESRYLEFDEIYIFSFNDMLNLIDFKVEVVTMNIKFEYPQSEEELKCYIALYQKIFNLDVEIIEEMWGWWYLKITIPDIKSIKKKINNFDVKLETEINNKLENLSDNFQYYEENNDLIYLIDLKTPKNQNWDKYKFNVHKLRRLFETLNQIEKLDKK